jgi:sialic acid synthase SpsE
MLVSTGMATMDEIRETMQWIVAARGGLDGVTVLHCTSAYPAADESLNLLAIRTMASTLGVPIGYSDHSLGVEAAEAAVALGATVIEKHLTLDRSLPGPDHSASLEPAEFRALVDGVRRISRMLGDGVKAPTPQERDTARVARRSIVAATDIPAGAAITEALVAFRRPATGLAPRDLPALLGRVAKAHLPSGTVLQWDQFEQGGAPR